MKTVAVRFVTVGAFAHWLADLGQILCSGGHGLLREKAGRKQDRDGEKSEGCGLSWILALSGPTGSCGAWIPPQGLPCSEARGPAWSSSMSVCPWLQAAGQGGQKAWNLPSEAPIATRAVS